MWVNRNLRQVSRTGVDGSTPGDIRNAVSEVEPKSPFLIGIVATSPPCGINTIRQVENKWQSTSPGLVGQTPKLDAVVDGKLPDDLDSASIPSKRIGHKLSDSSIGDLYMRCKMNFTADPVQTQTPQFMDLGYWTINALDKSSGLITRAARIRRTSNGAHCSAPNHVFGETTAVGVSEAKSDHDYNYKTEFRIWKENK